MPVKMFYKEDCGKCPATKEVLKGLEALGATVEYYDVEDVDGMAEAAYYGVMSTPTTLVLRDDEEEEVRSWRGDVPDPEELERAWKSL
ncbi:MAG: thioredoxin family protein [Euryarchaeota archaeon]|nr:thioredoxin family protein [Euryarchaeota archaeon]